MNYFSLSREAYFFWRPSSQEAWYREEIDDGQIARSDRRASSAYDAKEWKGHFPGQPSPPIGPSGQPATRGPTGRKATSGP